VDDTPLRYEGIGTVTPEADKIQFSRQIWQAASEHAHRCLVRREFCPEQSRIENLRCVHLVDETVRIYGKQFWCFEAIGIDPVGRRHVLYGVLEFSIQYGLLEAAQTAMFEDSDHREKFLQQETRPAGKLVYHYPSTRFWVYSAWCSISVLTAVWATLLVNYLYK
jgi:hypothetical protein